MTHCRYCGKDAGNYRGHHAICTAPKCLHCGRNRAARGKRGLCIECYGRPSIRQCYPTMNEQESEVIVRPVRQPGDKYFRCLWCDHYRCDLPIRMCGVCQRAFNLMVAAARKLDWWEREAKRQLLPEKQ